MSSLSVMSKELLLINVEDFDVSICFCAPRTHFIRRLSTVGRVHTQLNDAEGLASTASLPTIPSTIKNATAVVFRYSIIVLNNVECLGSISCIYYHKYYNKTQLLSKVFCWRVKARQTKRHCCGVSFTKKVSAKSKTNETALL
jgi:hypothetical protein